MLAEAVARSLSAASWIRRMFEEGNRLRAEVGADNVFDFSLGNPHLEPPTILLDRLQQVAADPTPGMHRYMQNPGFPEVRAKVAADLSRREGVTVPPEHLVMTCGAAGAINVVLKTLLNPGDKVILFAPLFAEYVFYVMHAGGESTIVETTKRFDLDTDALAAAIDERTRAVIVNSPNNPTGRVYPQAAIDRLAAVLTEQSRRIGRPIVLLSDEPYRRLVYDAVVPPLMPRYDATIIVASFSKDLGLAGERVGYLAVHPRFPDADRVMAGLIYCLRTLGFVNAPALMQRVVADSLHASVDIDAYRVNRDLLYNGLVEIGYDVVKPEGAFFLFPKSPIPDDLAFIARMQQERVLAVPGVGFSRPGHFRLSYAVPTEMIPRSLPGFAKAFNAVK